MNWHPRGGLGTGLGNIKALSPSQELDVWPSWGQEGEGCTGPGPSDQGLRAPRGPAPAVTILAAHPSVQCFTDRGRISMSPELIQTVK